MSVDLAAEQGQWRDRLAAERAEKVAVIRGLADRLERNPQLRATIEAQVVADEAGELELLSIVFGREFGTREGLQ